MHASRQHTKVWQMFWHELADACTQLEVNSTMSTLLDREVLQDYEMPSSKCGCSWCSLRSRRPENKGYAGLAVL